MKAQKAFYALLFLTSILISCDFINASKDQKILPSSSGKYGEVLVVVDTIYENSEIGDQLREIFNQAMPALPQQETQFRMATVAPKDFKSILKRSRNVLQLKIKPKSKTAIQIQKDVWAKGQLLIDIVASSRQKAISILEKNKQRLRDFFNEEELKRLQKQYRKSPLKKLMDTIRQELQVEILIPPGYVKMSSDDNGIWLKKEKTVGQHQVMQGVAIYMIPYADSSFTTSNMIFERNKFCKEHIQGNRENSFMGVYEDFQPLKKEISLNGKYAQEYRGLWNMKNDFMGGPFIHYSFLNHKGDKIIHLDGFVFAPKFNKREYLRELEAIMRTAKPIAAER